MTDLELLPYARKKLDELEQNDLAPFRALALLRSFIRRVEAELPPIAAPAPETETEPFPNHELGGEAGGA